MMNGVCLCVLGILFFLLALGPVDSSAQQPSAPETPPIPEDFTQFEFEGQSEDAQALNNYMWYHFHNRMGNMKTLFNKEYLMLADPWLNGAKQRGLEDTIQEVHARDLRAMELDEEGYVSTHQHFSHAHDWGWPFPMWTQADKSPELLEGKAAGWHFQTIDKIPGWIGNFLRNWQNEKWYGEGAIASWELDRAESLGIVENAWRVKAAGATPMLYTPKGVSIRVEHAPFLQLRWKRTGEVNPRALPYIEWTREEDADFGPDRRVYIYPEVTELSGGGLFHSIMSMYRHPKWEGTITRMRLSLAPGESDVTFDIDSFFTVYDTRHTINNPIYILANKLYFEWTGDLLLLRDNLSKMRAALRYMQTELGGLKYRRIRNPWPGHAGRPGFERGPGGEVIIKGGRGIGNNYWDLMPFGGDDLYSTSQYHGALLAMAEIEEAIDRNPGWNLSTVGLAFDPQELRDHAAQVKQTANELFWNEEAGRFIAAIDLDGNRYDYGYTFVNLDAIWYDLATEEHAKKIMEWITGERIVEGDTSTGADIYRWRFGPRASTKRNIDWYGQGWWQPEGIEFGHQIQDGGAVLGFAFYDLWARLKVLGADNAWARFEALLEWEREVQEAGGYRAYYADGKQGTTLQGGGTAGGVGIDFEFFESSLIPSIVTYGFMGIDPQPEGLAIEPQLPEALPSLTIRNLRYRETPMTIRATRDTVTVQLHSQPNPANPVNLLGGWDTKVDMETGMPLFERKY